jgi:hypothetical protein
MQSSIKKPIVEELPVLNPLSLSQPVRRILLDAYEELSTETLRPLSELNADVARSRIDLALTQALRLRTDLASIRTLMATEPLIEARSAS